MSKFQFCLAMLCWSLVSGICGTPTVVRAQDQAVAQDPVIKEYPKLDLTRDWPWWRGPHRNGIAETTPVPTSFGPNQNVLWKTAVPGRGHSSPVVVGNRIFLTTADAAQQIHSLLIFDRTSGELVRTVQMSQGGFPAHNHQKNTEATPTVACDGERIFATFFHHGQIELIVTDLEGNELWRRSAGQFSPRMFEYGYAPSPLLYQDLVIVSGEYDGDSFLTALRRKSGESVWTTPRPKNITFSSPVYASVAGRDQLLMSGGERVSAYDPQSGKQLWSVSGTTFATCGTMVWDGDLVFASGGFPKAETIAVKVGDSRKVAWRNKEKCYEQSMLAFEGHLYALTDGGILNCWQASNGQLMWKRRLRGPVSASPVLANGHIYWANEEGTLYVFKADPRKLDIVAENQIGTDAFASPAICGGQIFLRVGEQQGDGRQEFLYCFSLPAK